MEFKDYYKALGVSKDARPDEIKKAFRKLARKYHPDINSGAAAEAKFKDVNEAYEVLKDPERRAAYDQLGQEPPRGRGQPPPDWDGGYSFSQGGPKGDERFSDFFETLFRRGAGPGAGMHAAQGADSHGRIEITIEDAYRGATRQLSLRSPVVGPDGHVTLQERTLSVQVPRGSPQASISGSRVRVIRGRGRERRAICFWKSALPPIPSIAPMAAIFTSICPLPRGRRRWAAKW